MSDWYYAHAGGQHGPMSLAELQDHLERLPAETLVWNAGLQGWRPAGSVPETARRAEPVSLPASTYPPPGGGGAAIVRAEARPLTTQCRACGYALGGAMRFCGRCGTPAGQPQTALAAAAAGPPGFIEVQTGFFPLSFFFLFCTPVIEIDGVRFRRPWGRHRFPVPPGPHRIRIYVPYLFLRECGANGFVLSVAEGTCQRVRFWMPPWIFARGSLAVS